MSRPALQCFLAIACSLALQFASAAEHAPTPAPASQTGTIGQAPFRIDFPDHWNGELVVLAHGFEPVGVPRTSPMTANDATRVFMAAGYAVAQSAYATQGWAVGDAMADIERLRQRYVQNYGAARRTWLVGFSMGGGVALANLEQHPAHYDGALSLCGANLPGARLAEELFATLVAFDYFFPDLGGIPGGLSAASSAGRNQGDVMSAIAGALAGKPEVATTLANFLEVPVDAVPGVISLHYLVFQDFAQRAGGLPVDNRKTVYRGLGDDEAFNAGVRRVAGDAKAIGYATDTPSLSGHPSKPALLQYNHGDPTIAPRWQSIYAGLDGSGKASLATLPAVGEGHCGFSPEQIGQAFQTLVHWAEAGKRPAE